MIAARRILWWSSATAYSQPKATALATALAAGEIVFVCWSQCSFVFRWRLAFVVVSSMPRFAVAVPPVVVFAAFVRGWKEPTSGPASCQLRRDQTPGKFEKRGGEW